MIKQAFQWCYKAPFRLIRKHWMMSSFLALSAIVLFLTGRQVKITKAHKADLRVIYQKSVQVRMPDRNPVIVIPGVLGSKLIDQETNQTIWGAFDLDYADPNTDEGFVQIALPIGPTTKPSTLNDNVVPIGVLDKMVINVLGIPLNIQAYAGILSTLGVGGYRDEAFGKRKLERIAKTRTGELDIAEEVSEAGTQLVKVGFVSERMDAAGVLIAFGPNNCRVVALERQNSQRSRRHEKLVCYPKVGLFVLDTGNE